MPRKEFRPFEREERQDSVVSEAPPSRSIGHIVVIRWSFLPIILESIDIAQEQEVNPFRGFVCLNDGLAL